MICSPLTQSSHNRYLRSKRLMTWTLKGLLTWLSPTFSSAIPVAVLSSGWSATVKARCNHCTASTGLKSSGREASFKNDLPIWWSLDARNSSWIQGIAFEKNWEQAYSGSLRCAEEVGWDVCCHLNSARKLILFRVFTGEEHWKNWPVIFRDIYSATVWFPSFQAYWAY